MHISPLAHDNPTQTHPLLLPLLLLQYLGDLFLVQQAVNLLGRVLDTPDSITAAPDHIGSLYKSVSALLRAVQACAFACAIVSALFRPPVGAAATARV